MIQADSASARFAQLARERTNLGSKEVLGAGLEPACLSAYAPQTYVSAIPPPEQCGRASECSAGCNGLQVAVAFCER